MGIDCPSRMYKLQVTPFQGVQWETRFFLLVTLLHSFFTLSSSTLIPLRMPVEFVIPQWGRDGFFDDSDIDNDRNRMLPAPYVKRLWRKRINVAEDVTAVKSIHLRISSQPRSMSRSPSRTETHGITRFNIQH